MGQLPLNRYESQMIRPLLRTFGSMFPSGTSVPTSAFLAGAVDLLGANVGSLTLVRPDPKRGILVSFDNMAYKLHGLGSTLHKQNLMNLRAWENDPLAKRLYRRYVSRPKAVYTFLGRRWINRNGWHDCFTVKVMQTSGWQGAISLMLPMDHNMAGIVTMAWLTPHEPTRQEARLLYHLTLAVHDRVVDLRGRGMREELPASVRETFEMVLSGATEKEIAVATKRKINTVHDQVKRLYSHFGVNSRAQLMAKFIDPERIKSTRL